MSPSPVSIQERPHGTFVQLRGEVNAGDDLDLLRRTLLGAHPRGAEVIVDAAEVTGLTDDLLALLWAGLVWIEENEATFTLSAASSIVSARLSELGLDGELPDLEPAEGVPAPRPETD